MSATYGGRAALARRLWDDLWDDPLCDSRWPLCDLLEEAGDARADALRVVPANDAWFVIQCQVETPLMFTVSESEPELGQDWTVTLRLSRGGVVLAEMIYCLHHPALWSPERFAGPVRVDLLGTVPAMVSAWHGQRHFTRVLGERHALARTDLARHFPDFFRERMGRPTG